MIKGNETEDPINSDEIAQRRNRDAGFDTKSEEFHSFSEALFSYISCEKEEECDITEQISKLEYMASKSSELSKQAYDDIFIGDNFSFFVQKFMEIPPTELSLSYIVTILSEIVWLENNLSSLFFIEFGEKLFDIHKHGTGKLLHDADLIFSCLVQYNEWNQIFSADFNIEFWEGIIEIEEKLRSFKFIVAAKESLANNELLIPLMQKGINLITNEAASEDARKNGLNGLLKYLTFDENLIKICYPQIEEMFTPDLMSFLSEICSSKACSKVSFRILNWLHENGINDKLIEKNIPIIISETLEKADGEEDILCPLFYFWGKAIEDNIPFFVDDFIPNLMEQIRTSTVKVRTSAISLLTVAIDRNNDFIDDLDTDDIETLLELLSCNDIIMVDSAMIALTKIIDVGKEEVNEFIVEYEEENDVIEQLETDFIRNEDYKEEIQKHALYLIEAINNTKPKKRSYDEDLFFKNSK